MTTIKGAIVDALRHEPLNHYDIATRIHTAPFMVRAELKALKRDRLVRDYIDQRGHMWELTDRGHRAAYSNDQLELVR